MSHPKNEPSTATYKPSRYMRDRHPDLFSDSDIVTEYEVSREVLSYHLETLTNQKDETAFEYFAQRLCEKFIAPNIRPQTGPVGGGDGKTDAETYPVSSEISLRWFAPEQERVGERKAFAFSAKKEWRSKVKSDVSAIAGTGRNYDHIYFVTNQFVASKKSAEVQDELVTAHGIPVTILDRTWLLDRVLLHGSMNIAVEELGVGNGTETQRKRLGPNDTARGNELADLENQIADGTMYQGHPAALAEDARRAALLARGLEYSVLDVNGRFDRALRITKEKKLRKLELAITYDWAWTSYFWHDDHIRTSELYDDVERLAINSDDADDLERLSNLLSVIAVSVFTGSLDSTIGKLDQRTKALKAALLRLATQASRPNNALHAEALHLMTELSERGRGDRSQSLDDIWVQFIDVIRRAEGLGTFPFLSFADALAQAGEYIPESALFDTLFETITDALVSRSSEGEAATKNVQRAYQKLEKGLPYDAIRWFGRAAALLIKEEYEDILVGALVGAGIAFEMVGLPWAARNYTLAAASQQFGLLARTGSVSGIKASVLGRYFETELKLGRLPQILAAHELELIVLSAQARTEGQRRRLASVQLSHAMEVGGLLLRTPFDQLESITQLPDALHRLALPMARVAILHLFGHEDTLRQEGSIPPEETEEEIEEYFKKWLELENKKERPEAPNFCIDDTIALSSNVLGCRIEVECCNNLVSIGIGEAILGSLEALLATSLNHRVFPQVDHLLLCVAPKNDADLIPFLEFKDVEGESVGFVTHKKRLEYNVREDTLSFANWLKDAILEILMRFVAPHDAETWGKTLFEDERALDRALTFSNIPIMLENIFGNRPQLLLTNWIEKNDRIYKVKRDKPWVRQSEKSQKKSFAEVTPAEGKPPEGMFDPERMKHSQTKWVSPIDAQKWDKAMWNGTIFLWSPPGVNTPPPMLGLGYQNATAARDIFRSWRKRYGEDDIKNEILITIVRGISKSTPAAYAVMVGPNPANVQASEGGTVGFVSRINRMYPQSTKNLDAFLADYMRHGRFVFIPVYLRDVTVQPEPIFDLPIGKHDLLVKNAWEIGLNDLAASVLDLDDLPYIPGDKPDAPVLKTLEWLRKRRSEF